VRVQIPAARPNNLKPLKDLRTGHVMWLACIVIIQVQIRSKSPFQARFRVVVFGPGMATIAGHVKSARW
jgi:hypothetical protein